MFIGCSWMLIALKGIKCKTKVTHNGISLCGVRICVSMNNFSDKSTRPRDMQLVLKDTVSIKDEKLFKICRSVCLGPRAIRSKVPPSKV